MKNINTREHFKKGLEIACREDLGAALKYDALVSRKRNPILDEIVAFFNWQSGERYTQDYILKYDSNGKIEMLRTRLTDTEKNLFKEPIINY